MLSRRLECRSNVVYTWEAGRRWPTGAQALKLAELCGIDVRGALEGFFNVAPVFLSKCEPATRDGVADLLSELRANIPIVDLARRTGLSRFAIARFLSGEAEPKLPDFLRMVDVCSLRGLDFIARLVDPRRLPATRAAWRELQIRRKAVFDHPFLPAVFLVLETVAYRCQAHSTQWVADRLKLTPGTVERCMEILIASGQVRWSGDRYLPVAVETVDTRPNPVEERKLKAHWSRVGTEHIERGADGLFSFNVFTISRRDYGKLQELHRSYFRQLRALCADTNAADLLVAANVQLFELGG